MHPSACKRDALLQLPLGRHVCIFLTQRSNFVSSLGVKCIQWSTVKNNVVGGTVPMAIKLYSLWVV